MMSCAEVRPILSFLIEKETGPLETLEARRHLDACAACRSRAARMGRVMTACAELPQRAPAADVASSVMRRLRALKRAGAGGRGWAPASARWSGLAVLLGAGLALLSRPVAPVLKAVGDPLAFLAGLVGGGEAADAAASLSGKIMAIALRAVGIALRPEVTSGAGIDLVVTFQLLATALTIGLLLAIPVALLTLWFLHSGRGMNLLHRD